MNSNAMSHRNITYEARHDAVPAPFYAPNSSGELHHRTRPVEIAHMIGSSAETHVRDLQHISKEISSTLKQSISPNVRGVSSYRTTRIEISSKL
jgi:hypothetical protein